MSDTWRAERTPELKTNPGVSSLQRWFLQKAECITRKIQFDDDWKRLVRLGWKHVLDGGLRPGLDAAVKTTLVITGAFCCTPGACVSVQTEL